MQFDWNMTRNEIVADIGALQISHRTWHTLTNGKDRSLPGLEGLRPSQLFFISAAQVTISFFRFFLLLFISINSIFLLINITFSPINLLKKYICPYIYIFLKRILYNKYPK